jgi:hypothetical protein
MARTTENIGLLLVHGMGEQKELEHLTGTAGELASFISCDPALIRLNVDDESARHGEIRIDAVFRRDGDDERIRLHLREVWWADLGMHGGLIAQVKFWFWALGQWAAEAVRKGDPRRNTVQLMAMPRFGYQKSSMDRPGLLHEIPARFLLFGAGLLAFLTFFSWTAIKRVIAFLARQLPEPSLIFLFLGDVKVYQQGGSPGGGTTLDPDQPVRTTIRRRMVSAMTAMAARPDLDRWYIFAHSLGTVPAFNALQETELALPNYLSEAEWKALPARFRTSAPFKPAGATPSTDHQMPRRPPWLFGEAGIDRRRLFDRFAGLLTYGSPLDKFAALWPRIVCLNLQTRVFQPGCEWVNIYDPTDPVAASLDAFAPPDPPADPAVTDRVALVPQNFGARASRVFGLSHIRYLSPRRKRPKLMPAEIAGALVSGGRSSLAAAAARAAISPGEKAARLALALFEVVLLALFLAVASGVLLYLVGKALPDALTGPIKRALHALDPPLLVTLQAGGWCAYLDCALIMLALSAIAVISSGMIRIVLDHFKPPHG